MKKIVPATLAELAALTKATPGKYQLFALLAAWCGLRFGELAELRRSDVDVTNGVIHVRRGVWATAAVRVGPLLGHQSAVPPQHRGRGDQAVIAQTCR